MNKTYPKQLKPVLGISLVLVVLIIVTLALPSLKRSTDQALSMPGAMNLKLGSGTTAGSDGRGMMVGNLDYAVSESAMSDSYYAPSPMPPATYGGQTAADAEQRLIKTADLSLGVDGVADKVQAISTLATGRGGFVQSSTILEDEEGYKTGYITVRVPTATFEDTIAAIKDLAVRVDRESINGQDVTEQYTDIEARLRSSKAQEEQYLLILDKAETVQDILSVQSYLQNVRYEIESLEGQLQHLGNQTEYSTISVSLQEEVRIQVPAEKFDLGRNIKLAAQYVVLLAQAGLTFLVWLVIVGGAVLIPLSLILVVAIWIARKIMLRF